MIRNWLARFFYGRNGADPLALALLLFGMLLLLAARLADLPLLAVLYWVCLFLAFYRILSRNLYKRREENRRFMALLHRIRSQLRLRGRMLRELPTHKYLKCPNCRQRLRVPRGKGKINIHCTQCGEEFVRKS